MLKVAKTVKDGMLVSFRGEKFIRANKRSKIAGVYQEAKQLTVMTDHGIQTVQIPRGVITRGPAEVILLAV